MRMKMESGATPDLRRRIRHAQFYGVTGVGPRVGVGFS